MTVDQHMPSLQGTRYTKRFDKNRVFGNTHVLVVFLKVNACTFMFRFNFAYSSTFNSDIHVQSLGKDDTVFQK